MVLGNPNRINLCTSSYKQLRKEDCLYIDKTMFIEHFLDEPNTAQLIARQRRLGKSLNLDTLRLFLTDKENNEELFLDTYIKTSAAFDKLNSAPVFLFDFKNLTREKYKEQIKRQVITHINDYVDTDSLTGFIRSIYEDYLNDSPENTEGLLILTDLVFRLTGKHSYILIDEYDKLLADNYQSDKYDEIKEYETNFLSAGLKGNNTLAKALLTGVMRVSRESILSGLNNLRTYDLYSDKIYTNDFGFSECEVDELQKYYNFSRNKLRQWYNGIRINGKSIYNTYSVLSYLESDTYDNYWGKSGTIQIISGLLNDSRREDITRLLNGESVLSFLKERISLRELTAINNDSAFYSLLLQTGYLSLENIDEDNKGTLKIPNIELMRVWKEFILSDVVNDDKNIRTIFDNVENLVLFSRDIECFLSDRLSYFDLEMNNPKLNEKLYHIFVLGILSAYRDTKYTKPPYSNRESGNGRYDILFERKDLCFIFEFKTAQSTSELKKAAETGLQQINEKRYFADAPKNKQLIKTAIAFCGKECYAKSELHEW